MEINNKPLNFILRLALAAWAVAFSLIMALAVMLLIALGMSLFAKPAEASNCGQFFVKQQYAAAVVAPVYAAPVYYQAGRDIEAEALAAKITNLAVPAIMAEVRQQLQAGGGSGAVCNNSNGSSNNSGSLGIQQQPVVKAFAKCVSCHSGENAKGGIVLDGSFAVNCYTYRRWGEMAALGKDVPPAMQKLISAMTPEEKGAVNEAMLLLPEPKPEGSLR